MKEKLNDEQYQACVYNDWSSLILAWAWSWKTRTLTYKIAYLISQWVNPDRIFGVTFTNKAAKEMKERLVEIINDFKKLWLIDNLGLWYYSFKWIGTFHSLFLKILREDIEKLNWWYSKDFWVYDPNDSIILIKKIIKDLWLKWVFDHKEAKSIISKLKNDWLTYEKFAMNSDQNRFNDMLGAIYKEYQKQLRKANVVDFDDLLLLPYWLFKYNSDILNKWQNYFDYIMVDEAQDTNQIQFELMKLMAKDSTKLTFIWDDYQSIYKWRWAKMDNFLNLKQYWPNIKTFKLQINYRSKPHIVEAWNCIIKNNQKQYSKTVVAHRTWNEKIFVFNHSNDLQEAMNIIDFIVQTKENKQKKWSDFAILYRANFQSSLFEKILIQQAIPYHIYWAYKFFERAEIKDMLAYIKCLLNPKDDISLLRIINVPKRSIWKTTIDKIQKIASDQNQSIYEILTNISNLNVWLNASKVQSLRHFLQEINYLQDFMKNNTVADLIVEITKKINYKDYLIKEEWKEKGEDKFENIWQLINMAQRYEKDKIDEENIDYVQQVKQFLEEVTLMTDIAQSDKEQVDAIRLMTIHASKWLEFPFVFVVGLEENNFPTSNANLNPEDLEEERRLMYVAITRAKDHLFLSYADSRMKWWRTFCDWPSRFIDEIDPSLIKKYELWWVSYNYNENVNNFDLYDRVKHKLFWEWEVIEVWNEVCVVKFDNPKFWVRKIESRYLELVW